MSDFDRQRAEITNLQKYIRQGGLQMGAFSEHEKQLLRCADMLDACFVEIDRQAAIIRAAIDDVPGYPCGCSHELDQDGVVTAVHTTCEAHRRLEAQMRRLQESVQDVERLTHAARGEGNHRLLMQIRDVAREAQAETEGP